MGNSHNVTSKGVHSLRICQCISSVYGLGEYIPAAAVAGELFPPHPGDGVLGPSPYDPGVALNSIYVF